MKRARLFAWGVVAVLAVTLAVHAGKAPDDAKYIGSGRCKMCHGNRNKDIVLINGAIGTNQTGPTGVGTATLLVANQIAVTYKNGETCPAGTPDAGKTAQVGAALWSSFVSKTPVINANPASAHVQGSSLITVSFVPSGATVLRPSQASITQMRKENAGSVATTTTSTSTSTTSTTTSPSTTTTTMARTSTTTKQG